MTEETQNEIVEEVHVEDQPSPPRLLGRIGRVLFRLLVAIVIGLALGLGLYFGAARLYREVIQPIQAYEDRISDLEREVDQLSQAFETEREELNNRQAELEGRLATNAEALASAEALVEATQQDLREQRRVLNIVEDLEADVESMSLALGDLALLVDQLEADIIAGDLPAQRVQRTAIYLRAMSLLTRAQLELDRDNLGFAAEQVSAAGEIMRELTITDPEGEVSYGDEQLVESILERLEIALSDLPDRPQTAGGELEAVWSLMLEALQTGAVEADTAGGE